MSLNKRMTILPILTISFFAILFGIVILGSILTEPQLLCVWIALGAVIVYSIASITFVLITRKKDKKKLDDME